MATPTIDGVKLSTSATSLPGDFAVITWALTTADHTGDAVQYVDYVERSIQFTGTWGGATAKLEGSNDNVTWFALSYSQGTEISMTANGLARVQEITRYVRARLTTVGTGAAVSAALFVKAK